MITISEEGVARRSGRPSQRRALATGRLGLSHVMEKNRPSPHTGLTLFASVGHPDCKRRGEASEAEFVARCTMLDLAVAKPWGDDDAYDVLVRWERIFWRVQVKSSGYRRRGQHGVRAASGSGPYTKDQIDFLAAHVVPANLWYIIPVEALCGRTELRFGAKPTSRGIYERYREAWCLLACPPPARGWKGIPTRCRCPKLGVPCAVCPDSRGTGLCGTDTPVDKLRAGSVRRP